MVSSSSRLFTIKCGKRERIFSAALLRASVELLYRCRLLKKQIELIEIDRLNEVMLESVLLASTDIVLHSKTGKGNSENGLRGLQRLHQVDAATVGESRLANDLVKF